MLLNRKVAIVILVTLLTSVSISFILGNKVQLDAEEVLHITQDEYENNDSISNAVNLRDVMNNKIINKEKYYKKIYGNIHSLEDKDFFALDVVEDNTHLQINILKIVNTFNYNMNIYKYNEDKENFEAIENTCRFRICDNKFDKVYNKGLYYLEVTKGLAESVLEDNSYVLEIEGLVKANWVETNRYWDNNDLIIKRELETKTVSNYKTTYIDTSTYKYEWSEWKTEKAFIDKYYLQTLEIGYYEDEFQKAYIEEPVCPLMITIKGDPAPCSVTYTYTYATKKLIEKSGYYLTDYNEPNIITEIHYDEEILTPHMIVDKEFDRIKFNTKEIYLIDRFYKKTLNLNSMHGEMYKIKKEYTSFYTGQLPEGAVAKIERFGTFNKKEIQENFSTNTNLSIESKNNCYDYCYIKMTVEVKVPNGKIFTIDREAIVVQGSKVLEFKENDYYVLSKWKTYSNGLETAYIIEANAEVEIVNTNAGASYAAPSTRCSLVIPGYYGGGGDWNGCGGSYTAVAITVAAIVGAVIVYGNGAEELNNLVVDLYDYIEDDYITIGQVNEIVTSAELATVAKKHEEALEFAKECSLTKVCTIDPEILKYVDYSKGEISEQNLVQKAREISEQLKDDSIFSNQLNLTVGEKLVKLVEELYRVKAVIGDGSTMDALVDEANKGKGHDNSHYTKVKNRISEIQKIKMKAKDFCTLVFLDILESKLEFALKYYESVMGKPQK